MHWTESMNTVPAADREDFVRANAVAVVTDLEGKVKRQRAQITKLAKKAKSHLAEITKLRSVLAHALVVLDSSLIDDMHAVLAMRTEPKSSE